MLETFDRAVNSPGLDVDAPEAVQPIGPNQPGAKMTAFCVGCQDEGDHIPMGIDRTPGAGMPVHQGRFMQVGGTAVGSDRHVG